MADNLAAGVRALEQLANSADANPESPGARRLNTELALTLARAFLAQDALDMAVHWLQLAQDGSATARRSELAALWLELARAVHERADAQPPVLLEQDALRRAMAADPAQGGPALGQFLERAGRFDEAVSAWTEAASASSGGTGALLNLARSYERLGRIDLARATYLRVIDASPTGRSYLTVAARLADLGAPAPGSSDARELRVALLGNATLDHLTSYVTVECIRAGLQPTTYQAGFDQYVQEVLDPESGLYRFNPEVVILAIHASRLFPRVAVDPSVLSVAEREADIVAGIEHLGSLLERFTARSSAMVLLHNVVAPQHPAGGILDWRQEFGHTELYGEINRRLAALVRTRFSSVFIVDEDRVQSRAGKAAATDARLWYSARMPWSEATLAGLSQEYMRYILPRVGRARKCIVLDLDNTLWGGVIGEDGLDGIKLGADAPGSAFVGFQLALQRLWRRGILLAICSKNNPEDAALVFEHHPAMVLRSEHIAAQRVNWQPKPANLRQLASELNIGLDSLVFIDDNPVERAQVRAELPEVLVPEWPVDPSAYRAALLELGVFESLAVTAEDRNRGRLYAQQRERREFEISRGAESIDEFLSGLQIVARIEPPGPTTLARVAQLTTKTNQFNLTTRRYSEADIALMQARGYEVFGLQVSDRFGDNGLVGVAILGPDREGVREIDTLLLSCRVMGRHVETAMLSVLAECARRTGSRTLRGVFRSTAKNAPARDCYARHGFTLAESAANAEIYELDVQQSVIRVPEWLDVRLSEQRAA